MMEKLPLTKDELDKLKSILPKDSFDFYERNFSNQLNLFPETTKLIDCPIELSLNVSVNVLEQDAEGRNLGTIGVRDYTYHMPVPSGHNYEDYIRTFLDHFERAMITASDQVKPQLAEAEKNNE